MYKAFNLSHVIKVKLGLRGLNIVHTHINRVPIVNKEGFSVFQLHEFMAIFGPWVTQMSFNKDIVKEVVIYLLEEDLEDV